jgi:hypothetical protein
VAAIIKVEAALVGQARGAAGKFKKSGNFSQQELDAMAAMFDQLKSQSLQRLDELSIVLTGGKLRMSDAERMGAIDRIHTLATADLTWMNNYSISMDNLNQARTRLQEQNQQVRTLHDIK